MEEAIDGVQPNLPNSIAIASDGTIYWTDSDTNYKLHDGLYSLFVDGTGRLMDICFLYFNNKHCIICIAKDLLCFISVILEIRQLDKIKY